MRTELVRQFQIHPVVSRLGGQQAAIQVGEALLATRLRQRVGEQLRLAMLFQYQLSDDNVQFDSDAFEGQFDIWLVDPSGEVSVPLITHRRSDEGPSWSPDGRKLAFSSSRRGTADIYLMDVNGENLQRLTRSSGDNLSPAWGPFPR